MFVCDNCGRKYEERDLSRLYPDIPDLLVRLDPGGTVPAGECPACGALVYPEDEPIRLLILLDGGLVQDVLADKPGVEVAVLDMDLDGVDEEVDEVVEVTGELGTLSGTLQAHEITIAPEMVESAEQPAEQAAT